MTEETVIRVTNLTKDFGSGRGVFDVSFEVKRGEVFGFLGPNGAGKSTTIRHLLGFTKPHGGKTEIMGLDCWMEPQKVQKHIGYVAGEIAFPDNTSGWNFIKQIAAIRGVDLKRAEELCQYFQLKAAGELKRMSKGMKQKIALVIAFMHDADIIILDEPTSGLDPLMQARFCELIRREKEKGKTILMSSHIFEEIEKTCDRVAIIKQGKLVAQVDLEEMNKKKDAKYMVPAKFSIEKFFMHYYKDELADCEQKEAPNEQVAV
ncbi:MAG: ATP-binding cassette domain-containing protein [Firmicutes bacterium]|nr:ATP-binding cassette domain-containing protein [Bacillota bacterium]